MLWLRWFARKFWLLVVAIVISLAILVQTGRILSPQVGKYSPEIGHWLSERLGAPVALEHISLRWQALEVALQIDGLNIGAEEQVKLQRGLFHLDLLASIWNRELIWKNLEVDGFSAQLEQRAEGGWQVHGFPLAAKSADEGQSASAVRLGDPARIFQLGPKVLVRDARIGLTLTDGQSANLELPEILLENSGSFHRLVARAFVTGAMESLHSGEESLRLVLEGHGNPRRADDFSLRGYVQLNELLVDADLVNLLYQLSPLPEKLYWPGRKLAGGRLWLSSDSKSGYSLRGDLNLSQMGGAADSAGEESRQETLTAAARTAGALETLNALSSNISGRWLPGESWELVMQQLGLNWQQLEVPAINLQASGDPSGNLQLAVDQIELKAWHRVLRVLELIPEKADEWLRALEPTGELQNVRLSRTDGEVSVAANLHNVTAGAHRGAPAVTGVNGYLSLDGQGGRVELDSHAGFSAHFPLLYEAPFAFGAVSGTVAWDIDRDHNTVSVYSGPLILNAVAGKPSPAISAADGDISPAGAFRGQFLLQIPLVPHTRAADFTLALGLRDVKVSEQRNLVPAVVSSDLRDWLNQSIGRKNDGQIPSAGFVYRGYSYKEGEEEALLSLGQHEYRQTVQLQADIANSSLKYAKGWPAAENVQGHLGINDRDVLVVAPKARLWHVDGANVAVRVSPEAEGSRLDVRAQLAGPAADGLKLLRDSPLRDKLGNAFDQWALEGDMQGNLAITQPLGGAHIEPSQQVDIALSGAKLSLQNLKLDIDQLNGNVRYHSANGLKGSNFRGKLWGQPLRASIQHLGSGDERDTQVVVRGEAETGSIGQWSGRPELRWLDGALDYTARITIPARAKEKPYAAVLELSSDLEQVAVNLPAPLKKPAGDKSRFVLRVPIGEQGNLYHLSYGEHLQGQIWQVGGKLERAAIALNAEAKLPVSPGISIIGDLPQVDLQPWKKALAIYTDDRASGDTGADGKDADNIAASSITASSIAASNRVSATSSRGEKNAQAQIADKRGPPLPVTLDLSTDLLQLSESTNIENIHVRGRGVGADWQLQFDSETAAGELAGELNSSTPLQLQLAHLRLPALAKGRSVTDGAGDMSDAGGQEKGPGENGGAGGQTAALDRWSGFDFASLPPVDFRTESLWLGDEPMGPWSFHLRPSSERLVVSEIRGAMRGIQIEGRGEGENRLGAQLMWMRDEDGRESSQFIGRLRGENLGQVLESWGQEAVIESRSAIFDTALRWDGSPAMVNANGLSGEIGIDIRNGSFLRAEDSAGTSLLRLLSLFNFDTWARRLRLDFSDMMQSGLTFDRVHGEVYFEGDGELLIAVPIQVEGPTSELQMAGRVNLQREDLNLTLVATLPVGNNLAFVAALAGGLPAAAGVYLISKVFKKQVDRVASVSYRINGEWSDPKVRFDKLFDDGAAGREGESAVASSKARARAKATSEVPPPPTGESAGAGEPVHPASKFSGDVGGRGAGSREVEGAVTENAPPPDWGAG